MPRKVAFSHKQKREQLLRKRAIKRGDIEDTTTTHSDRRRNPRVQHSLADSAVVESARKLQSAFVKLPKEFLQQTTLLSASLPLPRPIPSQAAVWLDATPAVAVRDDDASQLTCPRRPKWRYNMSKKEVENNEEGLFKKWIDQTDALVDAWAEPDVSSTADGPDKIEAESMPRAPTTFERNLEVWRQLWRVVEISQIVLILLDSRCPLLHYPPSLAAYLASPQLSRKRTILVLTKVDISGPARADAWARYFQHQYPSFRVVQVETYAEKVVSSGRRAYEPHLPSAFRQKFVDALKDTHAELLQPPEHVRDDPEKLAAWKPSVKRDVDWDSVLNARGGKVGLAVGGPAAPKVKGSGEHEEASAEHAVHEEDVDLDFLTVGLIGQPNVGKSSLLNALFGVQKVTASKTPGKTKHFQTLFWTSDVRLVDCPGLVMPNLVPMETQVLTGILPISRVSAVSLCIYNAAQLLPLERIFALEHPDLQSAPEADKRTWRGPRPQTERGRSAPLWTAMDVLIAFAVKKGWKTARAGRPDINRAGNYILRMLAEGKIRWAFWPPDTPLETVEAQHEPGLGIWIPQGNEADFEISEGEHDAQPEVDATDSEEDEVEESSDESEDGEVESDVDNGTHPLVSAGTSRFAALQLGADGDEDEDNDN